MVDNCGCPTRTFRQAAVQSHRGAWADGCCSLVRQGIAGGPVGPVRPGGHRFHVRCVLGSVGQGTAGLAGDGEGAEPVDRGEQQARSSVRRGSSATAPGAPEVASLPAAENSRGRNRFGSHRRASCPAGVPDRVRRPLRGEPVPEGVGAARGVGAHPRPSAWPRPARRSGAGAAPPRVTAT